MHDRLRPRDIKDLQDLSLEMKDAVRVFDRLNILSRLDQPLALLIEAQWKETRPEYARTREGDRLINANDIAEYMQNRYGLACSEHDRGDWRDSFEDFSNRPVNIVADIDRKMAAGIRAGDRLIADGDRNYREAGLLWE
jgi:hypothetical protein